MKPCKITLGAIAKQSPRNRQTLHTTFWYFTLLIFSFFFVSNKIQRAQKRACYLERSRLSSLILTAIGRAATRFLCAVRLQKV